MGWIGLSSCGEGMTVLDYDQQNAYNDCTQCTIGGHVVMLDVGVVLLISTTSHVVMHVILHDNSFTSKPRPIHNVPRCTVHGLILTRYQQQNVHHKGGVIISKYETCTFEYYDDILM